MPVFVIVNTAPLDAPPEPAAGFVGSATGVPYKVPTGTISFVLIEPVVGIFTYAVAASFTKVAGGSTKICKVAFAQSTGLTLHTSYTILTVPVNPAVGVKVYAPFAFIVKTPSALVGPVISVADKIPPALFISLVNRFPVTLLKPLALVISLS